MVKMHDIDEIRRENIRLLEKEAGSPTVAANMVDMELAQFVNLRDGAKDSKTGKKRGMRKETAWRIEDGFKKPRGWLNTHHMSKIIDLDTIPEIVRIRRLSNRICAGVEGFAVYHDERESTKPAFVFLSWAEKRKFDPNKLLAMFIEGNCMEPNLWPGDQIIINTDDIAPQDGVVFAVRYEKMLIAKRLRRNAGQWWLDSDNPDKIRYASKLFTEDAQIIGRVVYRRTEVI